MTQIKMFKVPLPPRCSREVRKEDDQRIKTVSHGPPDSYSCFPITLMRARLNPLNCTQIIPGYGLRISHPQCQPSAFDMVVCLENF